MPLPYPSSFVDCLNTFAFLPVRHPSVTRGPHSASSQLSFLLSLLSSLCVFSAVTVFLLLCRSGSLFSENPGFRYLTCYVMTHHWGIVKL